MATGRAGCRGRCWSWLALAILPFAACDEPSAPDGGGNGGAAAEWAVGADGGTFSTADGRVTLQIPSGALEQPLTITAAPVSVADSLPVVPGTAWAFGPDGTRFTEAVELTIRYDPDDFAGDPEGLRIVEVREAEGLLEVTGHVGHDGNAHTVTGRIGGFSQKGVAYCGRDCLGPDMAAEYLGASEGVRLSWPQPTWELITIYRAVLRQCEPGETSGQYGPYTCVSDPAEALTPPADCEAPGTASDGRPCRYEVWVNGVPGAVGERIDRSLGPRGAVVWYQASGRVSPPLVAGWMYQPQQVSWFGTADPPEAPGNFTATAVSDSSIRLSWQPTPTATGYEAEVLDAGAWAPLAELPFSTFEFEHDGLEPATRYDYRIRSINDHGASPYALADATTAEGPTAPAAGIIAFSSDRDGNMEIYTIRPDGTGLTRLTDNGVPDDDAALSPDRGHIAFASRRDGNLDIYVMNADGSAEERLTSDLAIDALPAWSPDGSRIAFHSTRNGLYATYAMDADGSNLVQLTNPDGNDLGAAWSPDGSRIAFTRYRTGTAEIFVMNADGSDVARLTTGSYDTAPAWSPDGSRIAFVSNRVVAGETANMDIYVMNADGTGITRLTTDPAFDDLPAWSPDGARIAFLSDRDGDTEIYIMDADGSGVAQLTDNDAYEGRPSWR